MAMGAGELSEEKGSAEIADEACARAPIGLLAELTHRCPLQCPYCSNPVDLERVNTELTTEEWQSVMRQAAALGILQIHLSGGEPTARRDLVEIVKTASECGLYTNLITAAVLLKHEQLEKLKEAGVDAKLVVKEGGRHGWPNITEQVPLLVDWCDAHLIEK